MSIMGPLTKREHDAYRRGDRDGYSLGFTCGQVNEWCFQRDRVRSGAFGAIRRAAEVARECDLYFDAAHEFNNADVAIAWARRARDVRRAIRAAIGSPKS